MNGVQNRSNTQIQGALQQQYRASSLRMTPPRNGQSVSRYFGTVTAQSQLPCAPGFQEQELLVQSRINTQIQGAVQ